MHDNSKKRGGFTLIEMMIVVVVIAILVAVALVAYTRHIKQSRLVAERVFVSKIQAMQETYFQQTGFYCKVNTAFEPGGATPPTDRVGWNAATFTSWSNWETLGARPNDKVTYFQWKVEASLPTAHAAPGSPPGGVTIVAGSPWYYIHGRADLGGDGAPYTEIIASSNRNEIWTLHEGE